MTFNRKKILNLIFYVLIAAVLFTPLGFKVKVYVNRIFSGSASSVTIEEQVALQRYNWNLVDGSGSNFNLKEHKGKVILVNFWATWCPPCVAEMPSLQKLYADYKDKVVFVLVAEDKVAKVNTYLKENEFNFKVYYSKSNAPKELVSKVIPTTYILNKEGKIVVNETGAKDWNSTKTRDLIENLLKE